MRSAGRNCRGSFERQERGGLVLAVTEYACSVLKPLQKFLKSFSCFKAYYYHWLRFAAELSENTVSQ